MDEGIGGTVKTVDACDAETTLGGEVRAGVYVASVNDKNVSLVSCWIGREVHGCGGAVDKGGMVELDPRHEIIPSFGIIRSGYEVRAQVGIRLAFRLMCRKTKKKKLILA